MSALPKGTVTFLFTDVEGSTALWEHYPDEAQTALIRHDVLVEEIVAKHHGVIVRPRCEGDSRFAVFTTTPDSLEAAVELQQALFQEQWPTPTPVRVRVALHTGEADLRAGDYYGSLCRAWGPDPGRTLLREEVGLLTFIGPGGTGKTRLALQVAAELIDHFEDGVYFVNLAPIVDPHMVAEEIAEVLGVKESGGRSLLQSLKDRLHGARLLLVLDNFEQVVEAGPQLAELLASAAQLKLLVTSRVLLNLAAEQAFPVPPLALPDVRHLPPVSELSGYDAVRLFVERAMAVNEEFILTETNASAIVEI